MRALYAFCFAPASLAVELSLELGLDTCGWEDPVYISPTAGLKAILSSCPAERFADNEAEQRLGDLDWLLPRVEAHDRVIARAMTATTVFPLPFGTLFSSAAALAMEAARRRHTLLDFFKRMAGREEWAVKALLDRDRAITARQAELFPDSMAATSGGRGYLLAQRQKVQAERALGPWLAAAVADLDTALRQHSEAVVTRSARDPAVANRACLVGPGGSQALRAALTQIGAPLLAQGLELHCSGPWPLYSFCGTP
ncbi:GvpL/GvpF family gas vesicle protein [uncultured Thiodictyon sp.]|uniref:GvpL/GvpF family gas vesicle protein n=1 Tax=uncultured Thiodictyon sp. TaxID=1846217 RepID=UPI0025D66788|nr:GvpL/GvpF family gas vesicle protein [uncultured Thiodictyon sp.]